MMALVFLTCVPPQSSLEKSPMDTTRTFSPYFSPNRAIAPVFFASSMSMTFGLYRKMLPAISSIYQIFCLCDLFRCHCLEMCKVKTKSVRSYQGTFLFYMSTKDSLAVLSEADVLHCGSSQCHGGPAHLTFKSYCLSCWKAFRWFHMSDMAESYRHEV